MEKDAKQERFEKGKSEIIDLVIERGIEDSVTSFSYLHTIMDANVLCGFCDAGYVHSSGFWFENEVQNMLDAWVKSPSFKIDVAKAKTICTMCGEGRGKNECTIGQSTHFICDECRNFLTQ